MYPLRFIFFLSLLLTAACQRSAVQTLEDSLNRKSAPYDHFTFQRTYPDTVFNWNAYRKVLSRAKEQPLLQERNSNPCDPAPVSSTPWTLQGPANYAGRINSIAVKPDDENTVLVGFAGGGIFKTTDAGATWTPVFDNQAELSIGALAFDPSNPNIAYAGTGDVNMPSVLYNGVGVYKSTDAGNTWQYLGLSQAGIISEILIHPTQPNTLWVSSMGNPYVRTEERGVYKSTDGGASWEKVLFVSNQAGCSSLAMSRSNPQVLYASFWDRLRNNSESFVWGPHAKVYKSNDGGTTWTHLTNGLPTNNNGRTGLVVSQQNADKAYVVYIDSLSTTGSMFQTLDGGQSWTPVNVTALENACANFGWYFGKMALNPNNDDDLYFHGILLHRRLSNGSWMVAAGGHADSHDLVFCPSGRRYWANDGGLYRNEPNQQAWIKSKNLPATQVYRTTYNPVKPNEYWLGAQDNGIKRGNAQNLNSWSDVIAADGFESAFHLTSPDTFWIENQWGNIGMTTNNGSSWSFTGASFGLQNERVNWDAPFFRSTHPPYRFYGATFRFLSSSNGTGFAAASSDLTDGTPLGPGFHNISCIGESPIQEGKLYAGTSDANVWTREPNGNWSNITTGLPGRYVTSVVGSPVHTQRIYTTNSGYRDDDYVPHIHRSDNNGQTWVDISGDLPPVPVNHLLVLPGFADSVLVAGTDAGVYASKNRGVNWYRLGTTLPAVPVLDLAHNIVNKQVVAATFGRGIWTFPIDSITKTSAPSIPVSVTVSGKIRSRLGEGVAEVSFATLATGSTNETGNYQLPSLPGCQEITLSPSLNIDPLNGVTVYDLVLISRHILNLEPITDPYGLIAGDANKSGTVTSLDIVALRKLILGSVVNIENNSSWRFVPADFVFSSPENPFADTFPEFIRLQLEQTNLAAGDFVGIKIGDIDNSSAPNLMGGPDERSLPTWPIWAAPQSFKKGESLEVPLSADFSQAQACQFTLRFDPSKLQWEVPTNPIEGFRIEEHLNTSEAAKGIIRLVFDPETSLPPITEVLLQLHFTALADGNFQEVLLITGEATRALAFRSNGEPLRTELFWKPVVQHQLSVFPNPVQNGGCWVLSPEDGQLQVFHQQGRLLWEQPLSKGSPTWIELKQAGIYFIQVKSSHTTWTEKVVVTQGP